MITRKLAVAFGLAIALMIPLVASSSARVLIASESDLETIQSAVATAETGIENPTHGFAVSYLAKDWDTLSEKLSEGLHHGQMVSAYAKLNSQSSKDGDEETVNAKDDDEKDNAKDDDEKDNATVDSSDQEKGKSSQAKGQVNKDDDEDDTAESLAAVTATATPEATETTTTSTHGQGNANANGAGKSRKP